MSIFKKPGSPFWWYDFYLGGKRHRGSTRQATKAHAQQAEAKVVQLMMAGEHSTIHNKPPYLVDLAPRFLAFIDGSRLQPKTKEYYRSGWRLLSTQQIAGVRIDTITRSMAALVTVPGGGSSVNSALRTLRRMLALASEWGLLQKVPKIQLARENQRERMISPKEEVIILAKASRTMSDTATIIMDEGMRPSEVACIESHNVDFASGILLVPDGKTLNSRRHLPMTQRVRVILARRLAAGKRWAFESKRHPGQPMKGSTLSTMFSAFKRKQGLPETVVLYSCRHTYATDLLEATGNIAMVKKAMGHSNLATTERYLHPDTAAMGTIMDGRNLERSEQVWRREAVQ